MQGWPNISSNKSALVRASATQKENAITAHQMQSLSFEVQSTRFAEKIKYKPLKWHIKKVSQYLLNKLLHFCKMCLVTVSTCWSFYFGDSLQKYFISCKFYKRLYCMLIF